MEQPKISILVPIYNVEAYLQRCIDSVLAQDFTDWEMILVDDGSPDRCPIICDEAAKMDSRIKVVHKENGGLVSARREGILLAKGKYVMFLDSDDWIVPNALSILYSHIQRGYDMVKGGARRVDENGRLLKFGPYPFEDGELVDTIDFLIKLYTGKVSPHLWGALYKTSLFDVSVFDETIEKRISLGEDLVTNMIVGVRLKRVFYTKEVVYNYFYNSTSIMSTQRVSPEYGKRLEDYLYKRVFSLYPILAEWQQAKFASYCFSNCFIPTMGFSKEYDHYRSFLYDKELEPKIRECTRPRYLLFAKYKFIYKMYSGLYRMLYRCLKPNHLTKMAIE